MTISDAQRILQGDLDPDFAEALLKGVAWEYDALFKELAASPGLDDFVRDEAFNRHRGERIVRCMARIARQHGVPFEFRRLSCNGQRKLLLKAGRVILIQEPISTNQDHPAASDFKRSLADVHGFVRQLELDLGDQPTRIRDWSGCVLSVLLHAPAGTGFTQERKTLGNIMLAVPDAAYQQWVLRLDMHSLAMYGRQIHTTDDGGPPVQPDRVTVTKKKRNWSESFGEK